MALYCLADEGRYRKVWNAFGVSRTIDCQNDCYCQTDCFYSEVSHAVRSVCLVITTTLEPKYVKIPLMEQGVDFLVIDFEKKHRSPQCIGAVDGTHIFIKQSTPLTT